MWIVNDGTGSNINVLFECIDSALYVLPKEQKCKVDISETIALRNPLRSTQKNKVKVNLSLCLNTHCAMKTYERVDVNRNLDIK
jgi:hypothetical protein